MLCCRVWTTSRVAQSEYAAATHLVSVVLDILCGEEVEVVRKPSSSRGRVRYRDVYEDDVGFVPPQKKHRKPTHDLGSTSREGQFEGAQGQFASVLTAQFVKLLTL